MECGRAGRRQCQSIWVASLYCLLLRRLVGEKVSRQSTKVSGVPTRERDLKDSTRIFRCKASQEAPIRKPSRKMALRSSIPLVIAGLSSSGISRLIIGRDRPYLFSSIYGTSCAHFFHFPSPFPATSRRPAQCRKVPNIYKLLCEQHRNHEQTIDDAPSALLRRCPAITASRCPVWRRRWRKQQKEK